LTAEFCQPVRFLGRKIKIVPDVKPEEMIEIMDTLYTKGGN